MDVTCQAPLSMKFSRQEYWSGLPFPSPGDLLDPGIKPGSPALQADSLPSEPPGKPLQKRLLVPSARSVVDSCILWIVKEHLGFPSGTSGKEPTWQSRICKRLRFDPWVGKIPWGRTWQPTPVILPGESHGQRSLVGCSPWGCKESPVTEHLHSSVCEKPNVGLSWLKSRLWRGLHSLLEALKGKSVSVFAVSRGAHFSFSTFKSKNMIQMII